MIIIQLEGKNKKNSPEGGIDIIQFECCIRNRRPAYANQYSQDRNITRPMKPMASSAVFAVSPMWMEENNFFIKENF
ncbi:MAG TPA: hypothetical protein VG101_14110 [Puia sp.]|jgi:hypothetical protein|nr:hypothetical protein [Puia sp.]